MEVQPKKFPLILMITGLVILTSDGKVVIPRGSIVYGRVTDAKKAGRIRGKAILEVEITDITIDNRLQRIETDEFGLEGDSSGTVRRTGSAAAIGTPVTTGKC